MAKIDMLEEKCDLYLFVIKCLIAVVIGLMLLLIYLTVTAHNLECKYNTRQEEIKSENIRK